MKIAEYGQPSPRSIWIHRIASLIVFVVMLWLTLEGHLWGTVKHLAGQLVALGFIWLSNDYYYDRLIRRTVSYRFLAWIALVTLPIAVPLLVRIFRFTLP